MISRKAIVAWVFSAIVGAGTVAMPGAALAHDWDHHHDGENVLQKSDHCARLSRFHRFVPPPSGGA